MAADQDRVSPEAARAFRAAQVDCTDRMELHPHPDELTARILRPTAHILHALEQHRDIHAGCTPLGILACGEKCVELQAEVRAYVASAGDAAEHVMSQYFAMQPYHPVP